MNTDIAPTPVIVGLLRMFAPELPAPCLEYRFDAGRRWRFDYCWPDARLALELDGGQFKARGGRHNTDDDRWKMSAAAAAGWRVLRFSPQMLEDDPLRCVDLIREGLSR